MVAHRPMEREAHEYLRTVKNTLKNKHEKYITFLNIMRSFKHRRIGIDGVLAKVKDLFKGQQELLLGFNAFLPKGYEITPEDDKTLPKKSIIYYDAIDFINKVKVRFEDDNRPYNAFLNLMYLFGQGNKSANEVDHEVNILFREHGDLCLEFRLEFHQFCTSY